MIADHKAFPSIVSYDEWLIERKKLLVKEKELTHGRDTVNAERRRLPMVQIEKTYIFSSPGGQVTLLDLFNGHRQLIVYHFMFDPDWQDGCPVCSLTADYIGNLSHIHAKDVSLVLVSRAPIDKLLRYKARMGWDMPWYSSFGSDFNYDFHVTLDKSHGSTEHNYQDATSIAELGSVEAHGTSVFLREEDCIFHTYSCYVRGDEALMGAYIWLDLTPFGRQEPWEEPHRGSLGPSEPWPRRHDEYDKS
jgi:predicted dithiol-disulfide oxidoreductase (DUF899 family)